MAIRNRRGAAAPAKKRSSAGILLYRTTSGEPEVLLGHPGGPFYRKKDLGAWTIPKGAPLLGESPEQCALRECREEIGFAPERKLHLLGSAKQRSGKTIICYTAALEKDDKWLEKHFRPGSFKMEWPPGTGVMADFPEIDQAKFFPLALARKKILPSQVEWIDRLVRILPETARFATIPGLSDRPDPDEKN